MLLNKTSFAFQCSVKRLAQTEEKLYFWTFTFVHVPINDRYAMMDWHTLHGRIQREFPGIKGLRVAEMHKSHGMHFHLIVNRRIPIRRIKELYRGTGHIAGRNRFLDFGRTSVSKCDEGVAIYLSKYLSKQKMALFSPHTRRWSAIGGFQHVKKNDIEFIDDSSRNKKKLFGKRQIAFVTMMMMKHYSAMWGSLKNWPPEHVALVLQQDNGKVTQYDMQELKRQANARVAARYKEIVSRFPKKTVFNPKAAVAIRQKLSDMAAASCRANGVAGGEDWDGETGYEVENIDRVEKRLPF